MSGLVLFFVPVGLDCIKEFCYQLLVIDNCTCKKAVIVKHIKKDPELKTPY